MPRAARIKNSDSIFHIMIRSISEISLYKEDEDKDKYLKLIKKYQGVFGFKVYGYCLMTNHGHLIIDVNGSDISKIMHGINQCYAQYFNKKYERCGHVFQDRFKSKVVYNNKYLITLSAYIHNNPLDIEEYKQCVENYKYSTLGIYLGIRNDNLEIVDDDFVMQLLNENVENARERYIKLVYKCDDKAIKADTEFTNEKSEYRSERSILIRDHDPDKIIDFVIKYTGIEKRKVHFKNNRMATESKALCVLLMRYFCNFTYKDICKVIGNLTLSRVSKLCAIGVEIIYNDEKYCNIIEDFLKSSVA
ncbi:Transposase IS200 like protein [Clostridium liquoris]|uniref:Transposase IS200 like protein n=1 Tax=Clostridium liquoris TaxID=1289519 RepID=A0A2T0B3S8_9CLOT|nr:transposase [Clostridium liquoris]PRR78532.1 Transposase IS200 like protein [Clostridium liquoris]